MSIKCQPNNYSFINCLNICLCAKSLRSGCVRSIDASLLRRVRDHPLKFFRCKSSQGSLILFLTETLRMGVVFWEILFENLKKLYYHVKIFTKSFFNLKHEKEKIYPLLQLSYLNFIYFLLHLFVYFFSQFFNFSLIFFIYNPISINYTSNP